MGTEAQGRAEAEPAGPGDTRTRCAAERKRLLDGLSAPVISSRHVVRPEEGGGGGGGGRGGMKQTHRRDSRKNFCKKEKETRGAWSTGCAGPRGLFKSWLSTWAPLGSG